MTKLKEKTLFLALSYLYLLINKSHTLSKRQVNSYGKEVAILNNLSFFHNLLYLITFLLSYCFQVKSN